MDVNDVQAVNARYLGLLKVLRLYAQNTQSVIVMRLGMFCGMRKCQPLTQQQGQ